MSPSATTFIFESINFLVLAAVLGLVFFRPVRRALEERRQAIAVQWEQVRQELAKTERLQAEADASHRELAAALEQREKQLEDSARQEAATIVAEARATAQRELEQMRSALDALSHSRTRQLAQAAATAAGRATGKLLVEIDGPDLQHALERAACQQLASAVDGSIIVEAQQPLSPESREILAQSQNGAGRIEFRLVPDLRPGIRIITDRGLIDATVTGLTNYTEQEFRRALEEQAP